MNQPCTSLLKPKRSESTITKLFQKSRNKFSAHTHLLLILSGSDCYKLEYRTGRLESEQRRARYHGNVAHLSTPVGLKELFTSHHPDNTKSGSRIDILEAWIPTIKRAQHPLGTEADVDH